jgi:hypothetical protein
MIDVSCFQCSFVCDELDGRFARMLNQSMCALSHSHLFLVSLQSSLSLSLSLSLNALDFRSWASATFLQGFVCLDSRLVSPFKLCLHGGCMFGN